MENSWKDPQCNNTHVLKWTKVILKLVHLPGFWLLVCSETKKKSSAKNAFHPACNTDAVIAAADDALDHAEGTADTAISGSGAWTPPMGGRSQLE